MKIIGITGSIASGKSELSKYIKSKCYNIVDADEISRNITKKNKKGYKAIIDKFSKEILDEKGEIDRKKLGNLVFNDKNQLEKLNHLLHPIIFCEIDEQIGRYKEDRFVFLDAPLLFETSLYQKCDEIILVHCDENIQIERIIKRDNKDRQTATQIIKNQMSVKEKQKKSNYIIENNTSIEDFHFKINQILNILNCKQ